VSLNDEQWIEHLEEVKKKKKKIVAGKDNIMDM